MHSQRDATLDSPPTRVPKELNALAFQVLLSIQPEANARDIQLRPSLAFDLPPCYVDELQFNQVLLILLRHAFDAVADIAPAHRVITISTMTDEHASVVLEISNPAPTISSEMFIRPNQTSGAMQFCRDIVLSQGGRLEAGNNVCTPGAAFRIILPPCPEMADV